MNTWTTDNNLNKLENIMLIQRRVTAITSTHLNQLFHFTCTIGLFMNILMIYVYVSEIWRSRDQWQTTLSGESVEAPE